MPAIVRQFRSFNHRARKTHFINSGLTPCTSRIWQTAREKPHWGMSGVPFIKTTSGLAATAASIFLRASLLKHRRWRAVKLCGWLANDVASEDVRPEGAVRCGEKKFAI